MNKIGVSGAIACLAVFAGPLCGFAQDAMLDTSTASGAQIGFHYENPQLQPAKYTFLVNQDGSGRFHSEPGSSPPPETAAYNALPQPQDRNLQISQLVTDRIFTAAREAKFFMIDCEDGRDKIAFQGKKMLSYKGPHGQGSCTYNWSKYQPVQKLTSTFEAIAYTLEEGRRLIVELKHDRLGVDAEMEQLAAAVKDGRAIEIENIRPELEAVIDDEAVLERARSRARMLLDGAKSTAALR